MKRNSMEVRDAAAEPWRVTLIDTGETNGASRISGRRATRPGTKEAIFECGF
jgi:hypothetical protein